MISERDLTEVINRLTSGLDDSNENAQKQKLKDDDMKQLISNVNVLTS